MKENRLQHDFIMKFGQTWPEYNHLLFEVNNNSKNKAHGNYRKSMGMKKNVSDLILIIPTHGYAAGLELKAPGSTHAQKHIKNQLNWGKEVIKNNGYYIMTSCITTLMEFTAALINYDILSTLKIQYKQLQFVEKQLVNKTIKF